MTDGFQTMPGLNVNQKQHTVIFFNATSLWSTWLSVRAGLSKPVLGPFTIQFDTFAASPVFTRNAWFGGCAGNLQSDQAVSLACLPPGLETFPFPPPKCSLTTFPSEAVGESLQVLCCPQVPAVGAGPALAQNCLVFICKAHNQGRFSV